jgi:hypothetical protein
MDPILEDHDCNTDHEENSKLISTKSTTVSSQNLSTYDEAI